MKCGTCHACCMLCGEPPFGAPGEFDALPDAVRLPLVAHLADINARNANTRGQQRLPCLWLKDGRCAHYELRPRVCHDCTPGSGVCLECRTAAPEAC